MNQETHDRVVHLAALDRVQKTGEDYHVAAFNVAQSMRHHSAEEERKKAAEVSSPLLALTLKIQKEHPGMTYGRALELADKEFQRLARVQRLESELAAAKNR